jgi:uncharacterized protein DUF4154
MVSPLAAGFLLGVMFVASAKAEMDEYHVKAALLLNFAKFVEWPAQAFNSRSDPIVICVLGENRFGNALAETLRGKVVEGRPFSDRYISDARQAAGCHMLFVNSRDMKRFRSMLGSLKGAGVLTVGETEGFAAGGGVINLKLEGGKFKVEINVSAAEYENLRISSKLLSLAQVLRSTP